MARSAGRRFDTLTGTTRIGEGTSQDLAWVRDLGRRSMMSSVSQLREAEPARVGESFERLFEFAFGQSHVLLVARGALGPLGFLLFLDRMPDEVTGLPQAFVVYVAVEPEARRQGIGRGLMVAAEAEARKRGLPYLSFMVTEENVGARELYAQLGYQTERRQLCKRV